MPALSIRARMAQWQSLVTAVILLAFAAWVYHGVRDSLFAQVDARLSAQLAVLETTVRRGVDDSELSEFDRLGVLKIYSVGENDGPRYRSDLWTAAALDNAAAGADPGQADTVWRTATQGIFHLKRKHFSADGKQHELAVAEDITELHRTLNRLGQALALGLPLGLLAAALGAYGLARRLLAPLADMARRAEAINAQQLSQRLTIINPQDEVGRLAQVLNTTLARLETAFEQLHCFTQNASHELRTPLAVLRSEGEAALQSARSNDELREVIGSMLEEVERLTRLTEGLLLLARADASAGAAVRQPERFDLSALANDVVDCLQVLADEKQQTLACEATQRLEVVADRDLLRMALMNLLGNAVRFTPTGGRITVRTAAKRPGEVMMEVQDNGPGIGAEHQTRIFERFYRVDRGRARADGGFGLGLAIARWAVEAHRGRLDVDSQLGRGSRFRVVLPAG